MKKNLFLKSIYVFFSVICFCLLMPPLRPCIAEEYPTRPISVILSFAPGGNADIVCRAFAALAEKHLGQPVVVVNKPGGRSLIGGQAVATAKPDGYTIGFLHLAPTIPEAYTFFIDTPYTSKDLKPIAKLSVPPEAVTVKADAPWNSLKELVEYARKNPVFRYGGFGEGSLGHLSMLNVSKAENVQFKHVTFEGDSKLLPAILGGHIPMATITFPSSKSQFDAGNVKILAFFLEDRLDSAPKVPTIVELGYHLPFPPFNGFFAPKGTPDHIINRLDTVVKKVAEDPSFIEKMRSIGIQVKYENSEKFTESRAKCKANIETFFKELGYVK